MDRQVIIAGNWKMQKTISEAKDYIKIFAPLVEKSSATVMLAVPFTAISSASETAKPTNVVIGAQNMSEHEKGAFTGEISSIMLKTSGAEFVLIGHSERRHVFNESDKTINKKMLRAIADDVKTILCVGEKEDEKQNEKTEEVIRRQLRSGLENIALEDVLKIIIAYEPVWAIGTGKTATPDIAENVHKFIRKELKEIYSQKVANSISILYGGSVKENNIKDLMNEDDIDGVLVGGASLDASTFANIVNY
jgi:triosephosphate isomerase (TIM)